MIFAEAAASLVSSYIGGDANSDARTHLGDAVWIVNELFRDGPETDCPAAADCDGDSLLTLGGVSCLTDYLYESGPPPTGPVVCTPSTRISHQVPAASP